MRHHFFLGMCRQKSWRRSLCCPGTEGEAKPDGMLIVRLRRAGRDHGPSQLRSLTLHPQTNCGFNCHRPCSTAWPRSPSMETLPARAGVESGMKQPPPRASPRRAGEWPVSFQCWEGEGKGNLSSRTQPSWPGWLPTRRSCPARPSNYGGAEHP